MGIYPMKTIICPTCKGQGINVAYACPGFRRIEILCVDCGGKKVLDSAAATVLVEQSSVNGGASLAATHAGESPGIDSPSPSNGDMAEV